MHRVELKENLVASLSILFNVLLMHRVELKGFYYLPITRWIISVPNAPCGVESLFGVFSHVSDPLFLMHRVELKGFCPGTKKASMECS